MPRHVNTSAWLLAGWLASRLALPMDRIELEDARHARVVINAGRTARFEVVREPPQPRTTSPRIGLPGPLVVRPGELLQGPQPSELFSTAL